MILRTTGATANRRASDPVRAQLEHGREVLYATFLSCADARRETPADPSPTPGGAPLGPIEAWKFAFVGSRCTECDRVRPPHRVCSGCRGWTGWSGAARIAARTVATYAVDRLASHRVRR